MGCMRCIRYPWIVLEGSQALTLRAIERYVGKFISIPSHCGIYAFEFLCWEGKEREEINSVSSFLCHHLTLLRWIALGSNPTLFYLLFLISPIN